MGRFDKIRYWNGSSWVQPNQIKYWNGSSWVDLGTNDSSNTNSLYAWNGSSWIRQTLNRKVNYGDKEWYCNADGGHGTMSVDSGANVNQNKFNFWFYCCKDYDNDKNVAQFGSTAQGWRITWLADGRIRWSTFYNSSGNHSYSSNSVKAYNWCTINVYSNSTGTGNGTLSFNGTNSTANRYSRHQYNGLTLTVGVWGMMYRDHIRSYGIKGNGNYKDVTTTINDFTVKSGSQTASNMTLNSANIVNQDTWITWE